MFFLIACRSDHGPTAPRTGALAGTITSSLGGPLANVTVAVSPNGTGTPRTSTTTADGRYMVTNVPVADGGGTVALSALPSNCATPAPVPYTGLVSGGQLAVDITVTCAPTTGSLTVTITTPNSVPGNVRVTGPSGFARVLTATQTLADLVPGEYTITGLVIQSAGDPIVNLAYGADVSGSPAIVTAGATSTAAVSYALRSGSGGLWVVDTSGNTVLELTSAQLRTSGTPTPSVVLHATAAPSLGSPWAAAVDTAGRLWVANASTNTLVAFAPGDLAADGAPTPVATIASNGSSLDRPVALAFDAAGDLWVANIFNHTVVEYTPAQLVAGGSPTPVRTIEMIVIAGLGNPEPVALAFDAAGNLWIADAGTRMIFRYDAAQLESTESIGPSDFVSLPPSSPGAIAFDPHGNLWVVDGANSAILEYVLADYQAGATSPRVTTSTTADGSLVHPSALAFDASGNLWVADYGNRTIIQYTAAQLAASGSPQPNVTVSGAALGVPAGLVFNPHAANLSLH